MLRRLSNSRLVHLALPQSQNGSVGRMQEYPINRLVAIVCLLLGSANAQNKNCNFEPDWRPTRVYERHILVQRVQGSLGLVTVVPNTSSPRDADAMTYELQINTRDCSYWGRGCSQWTPKADQTYDAEIVEQPRHLNPCVSHEELAPTRVICIEDHKGCYTAAKPVQLCAGGNGCRNCEPCLTDRNGKTAPTPTYQVRGGIAWCEDWWLESGEWRDFVHECPP